MAQKGKPMGMAMGSVGVGNEVQNVEKKTKKKMKRRKRGRFASVSETCLGLVWQRETAVAAGCEVVRSRQRQ